MNAAPAFAAPRAPYDLQPERAQSARANKFYSWLAGLYAFAVPWSDTILLPFQVQFSRPLAILAVLCLGLTWRAGNTFRATGFSVAAMALFIALGPIHLLSAADPERTGRRLLSYLGLFCMTLFLQQCVRTRKAYVFTLCCYMGGCWMLLANLGWNVASGNVQGDGRYAGTGFDPNDLAGQLALSLPIASYLAFTVRRGALAHFLYLPLAVIGILLTASRAGLVVLIFASLYPLYCLIRRMKRGKLSLAAAILVTVAGIQLLAPNISFHRLATLGDQVSRGDLNGRGAVWINGWNVYWDSPVFGIGAGAFAGAVLGGSRVAAHNTYLEVLVEHGAVGLALFLAVVASLFLRVRRFPMEERLLWWTVLAGWMILILTLSWENREYTWLLWAFCVSAVPRECAPGGGLRDAA